MHTNVCAFYKSSCLFSLTRPFSKKLHKTSTQMTVSQTFQSIVIKPTATSQRDRQPVFNFLHMQRAEEQDINSKDQLLTAPFKGYSGWSRLPLFSPESFSFRETFARGDGGFSNCANSIKVAAEVVRVPLSGVAFTVLLPTP